MSPGEYRGVPLGESLQLDAVIEVPFAIHGVMRTASGDTVAGQPREWTFIEFSVPAADADTLTGALSVAFLREGGWYCDFHSDQEVVVVFHDRDFRYQSGDRAARNEAERYARSMGVPESQLDWPEPQ
ncbi:MAG: hypothetical protein ACRDWE_03940 [Acidimicrobiales bacterium]